jgi:hypothetical protein
MIAKTLLTRYRICAIDSKYEIPTTAIESVILVLGAAPFFVGFVLGAATRVRVVLLLAPALAIATVYWVALGWNGVDHDMGRAGLVLATGFFGAAFVSLWAVGSAVGRLVRLGLDP